MSFPISRTLAGDVTAVRSRYGKTVTHRNCPHWCWCPCEVSNEKIFVLEDWFFLPIKCRNWKENDLRINVRQIFLAWWANDRFVFIDSILSLDETFWRVEKRDKSEQILRHSLLTDEYNLIEKRVLFVVRTSFIEWSLKPLYWNSSQIIWSFILIVNGEQVYLEWFRFVDSPRCRFNNDSFFPHQHISQRMRRMMDVLLESNHSILEEEWLLFMVNIICDFQTNHFWSGERLLKNIHWACPSSTMDSTAKL